MLAFNSDAEEPLFLCRRAAGAMSWEAVLVRRMRGEDGGGATRLGMGFGGSGKIEAWRRARASSKYTIEARAARRESARLVVIAAKMASGKETMKSSGGPSRYKGVLRRPMVSRGDQDGTT